MSTYIKLSTLEYPRHEGDIRLEHPEIREDQTWPNFPCPDTYALVEWIDPPTIDGTTQIVELQQPIQENGMWKMVWAVRSMTAEELDASARRLTEQQP